jgi:predicted acylesterase/phospholipase RssA
MKVSQFQMSHHRLSLVVLTVLILFIQGCATDRGRSPLPEAYSGKAQLLGLDRIRVWGDESPLHEEEWQKLSRAELKARYSGIMGRKHNYLAISGGGADGAFAAGFLVGWSEMGTRPKFTIVTGISTGALCAPFAFLGSAYDSELRKMYTSYATDDLIEKRGLLNIIMGDSTVDTTPLFRLIVKYYNHKVLDAIAAEYRKGRQLLIGTTNLDAGRPVIWNIGRIAVSGGPKAVNLIHKILLASASIPVAFPPVLIEVEAGGTIYDEMHVDGGATSQVFLYPLDLEWDIVTEKLEVPGKPNAYVIRNSRLKPEWQAVNPNLPSIAKRSIDSLIRTQGIGDIYRMYLGARRDGLNYHLTYIPDDFDETTTETFDPEYMGELFNLGYRLAKSGHAWHRAPPGFE